MIYTLQSTEQRLVLLSQEKLLQTNEFNLLFRVAIFSHIIKLLRVNILVEV